MEINICLCVFAHNDKLGGYFLSEKEELPTKVFYDESDDSLSEAKNMMKWLLDIDYTWPIIYDSYFYEGVNDHNEKIVYLVYSTYFPDIPQALHQARWLKVNDRYSLLKPDFACIIDQSAKKRF